MRYLARCLRQSAAFFPRGNAHSELWEAHAIEYTGPRATGWYRCLVVRALSNPGHVLYVLTSSHVFLDGDPRPCLIDEWINPILPCPAARFHQSIRQLSTTLLSPILLPAYSMSSRPFYFPSNLPCGFMGTPHTSWSVQRFHHLHTSCEGPWWQFCR